jgi:hypothetical protein
VFRNQSIYPKRQVRLALSTILKPVKARFLYCDVIVLTAEPQYTSVSSCDSSLRQSILWGESVSKSPLGNTSGATDRDKHAMANRLNLLSLERVSQIRASSGVMHQSGTGMSGMT